MSTNYFIRKRETTKLFYNKYFYKLLLYNPLVSIFRDKNWKVVTLLNDSKVKFEIVKIEWAKNKSIDMSEANKEIVYDIDDIYNNDG